MAEVTVCALVQRRLVTFRISEMYCSHGGLSVSVCQCVCVAVPCRIPTLLHGSRFDFGEMVGVHPSCALLSEYAIGA